MKKKELPISAYKARGSRGILSFYYEILKQLRKDEEKLGNKN